MASQVITPGTRLRLRDTYGNTRADPVPAGTHVTVRELVPAGTKGGSATEDTLIVECTLQDEDGTGISRAFGLTPRQVLDLLEPL